MSILKNLPLAGLVVIVIILILFILAVILLFHVCNRYRRLAKKVADGEENSSLFIRHTLDEFSKAYEKFGQDVNTPAIISDAVNTRLSGLLLCERFLNNAVSIFVTLGLFGTFLGLSLSVSSLTELISYSNTSEWLSVLDSVGGGLMSALSGMGVAFYTSLVGAGCSILLTVLRSIFSPATLRSKMETRVELWLDNSVAPRLRTKAAKDDVTLVHQMIDAMNDAANSMDRTLSAATTSLQNTMAAAQRELDNFNRSVGTFNDGIHDFEEVDYNLRGTVERLDVAIRDFLTAFRGSRGERSGDR